MLGLVVTMFGIAGLYVYLNAPFLAMMQILIYVGAISILIAFAIMLAGPFYNRAEGMDYDQKICRITGGVALLVLRVFCVYHEFVVE